MPDVACVDPAPEPSDGKSYRVWTVVIFGALAALLFGAISFMVFLSMSG